VAAAASLCCLGLTKRTRLNAVLSAYGGGVADLVGDRADRRGWLQQQVGGE